MEESVIPGFDVDPVPCVGLVVVELLEDFVEESMELESPFPVAPELDSDVFAVGVVSIVPV